MKEDILYSPQDITRSQQRFMTKVYTWMAVALGITGAVSTWIASSEQMQLLFINNRGVFIGAFILQLLMVASLSVFIRRLSATAATAVFVAYAVLTGVTLSSLFFIYTTGSLASTFFVTAGIFVGMSIYGYTTGNDLTKFGSLLFMLLLGLIIASIVNWFIASTMLYWITTYVGVFIFVGLIAVDTQKIKEWGAHATEGTDDHQKFAIVGALSLYLDFINLFIYLLRILGSRR